MFETLFVDLTLTIVYFNDPFKIYFCHEIDNRISMLSRC